MKVLGFSSDECSVTTIDSLSGLKEKLSAKKPSVLLGEVTEGCDHFYYIGLSRTHVHIGLCTSNFGKYAGCINLDENVLVYNQQNVYLIDKDSTIKWEKDIASVIYDVIIFNERIVVIEEIGIVCYDLVGILLWQVHSDLIESYKLKGDIIEIFTEGASFSYSAVSGKKLG